MKTQGTQAKRYSWYDQGRTDRKDGYPYDPPMAPGDAAHDHYKEGWDDMDMELELYGDQQR